MTMRDESARVALVVGGSRGIGRATSRLLASSGYRVVVASRTPPRCSDRPETHATAERNCDWIECDVADESSVMSLFKSLKDRYGRLDAVVNSAGINYVAPVALADVARCRELVQVNLVGAFLVSKSAVRVMTRQRHGRIVHIGSISGTIGSPYNAIYAASKAGVAGFVKSLALEVASLGITVNAIQPGTIHTDLFEQAHGTRARIKGISVEQQKRLMEEEYPQKRLIAEDEVAEAVAFLLGDGAGSITGHLLNIDGGRSVK